VIRLINLILLGLLIVGVIAMLVTIIRSQKSQQGKVKSKEAALPSDAGVREIILEGRKNDAIDLYRQFTGVDEFTARQAVDEIERELRLSDNQHDYIQKILEADGKAAAIEAHQKETGANLAEALEFVEAIEKGD
jgi:ribosomal protein L7/L12